MKGFTLVELLVALAALSLLAGAGIIITDVAVGARESQGARQADTRALMRLHASLKADLGQAAARRARDETGQKPGAALQGRPNLQGETFLALVRRGWDNPGGERRSSLQYVEYALRDGAVERRIRRRVDGAPLGPPQRLVDGVRDVRLRYRQYDQWAEGWAGSPLDPLPQALAIELEFDGGQRLSQAFLLPGSGR
jgi:general secretion pathway protein J